MKLKKSVETKRKSYNIELGFISKLIENKDMKLLKDLDIKSSFLTGENKRVFLFIQKSFKETGEVPTYRVLKTKFPEYELETYIKDGEEIVGTEESLPFWCRELRTKAKHNKMADALEEIAGELDEGETEKAYEDLKKTVWQIENDIVESDSVDITKDTDDRKQSYLERKKHQGMMGIPTGIPHLDYMLKGLVNGTLTTVIATTGVGKSWFLVLLACYAQIQGYRVLMFLTEMSSETMRDRCEAMLYGMTHGNFNYNRFKAGSLDPEEEEDYFDFLDNTLPSLEPMILETATGVSGVAATIEKDKPDLILIDSAYLMEDEQGAKDDWQRITHITRDLKRLAKRLDLPFCINMQADIKSSKKTPNLGDIKYSQAIAQDSDNVLALHRDPVMIADNQMAVKVQKQREGTLGKVVINWNFKKMDFSSIYSEVDENGIDKDDDIEENEGVIGME